MKCGIEKGTLFHCLWECEEIQKFWKEVTLAINSIVNITLNPDPKLFLLGLYPPTPTIKKEIRTLINMCLLHAKCLIALYWRKIDRPKLGHWLRDMSSSLAIEKITYILKGKKELFEIVWKPFI